MIHDPTTDEMREFLTGLFGRELDAFDREEAIYWFAYAWHGGQGSNLYSALSTSAYTPGPITQGPEEDSMSQICLDALEGQFT